MKKILYFDCSAGISGDMTLGALIHLGVDIETLKAELRKLNISAYKISAQKGQLNGISGINLIVETDDDADDDDKAGDGAKARALTLINDDAVGSEVQGLALTNHEPHAYEHSSDHDHRSFQDISELIALSRLSDNVKKMASDIGSSYNSFVNMLLDLGLTSYANKAILHCDEE